MLARLAVVLAALALVAPAHAAIVPQKGIAGAQLRMTRAQVVAELGPPARTRTGTNDFGPYSQLVYARVTVTFQGNARVTGLRTTSRRERTARGVGPGSTEAQVRARVAGVRCRTEFGFRHCWLGRFLAGRTVTDFHIRRGRVTAVTIGYVLD